MPAIRRRLSSIDANIAQDYHRSPIWKFTDVVENCFPHAKYHPSRPDRSLAPAAVAHREGSAATLRSLCRHISGCLSASILIPAKSHKCLAKFPTFERLRQSSEYFMRLSDLTSDQIRDEISNIDKLLDLPDSHFIRAAFVCLLKREPDSHGGGAYRRQLARGEPKISILYQLTRSSEGRVQTNAVIGLDAAIERFRKRDANWFYRWRYRGNADTGRAPAIRAARAVKNQIERLEIQLAEQEERLGLALAQLARAPTTALPAPQSGDSRAQRRIVFQPFAPRDLGGVRGIDLLGRHDPELRHLKI